MMPRLAILVSIVLVAGCASTMDGPGMAGWRVVGDAEWRVADGEVSAAPQDAIGFLVSDDPYSDFRLSVEFNIDDDTNSGIFVRCTDIADTDSINPMTCFEANIWDNHPNQDFRTGSIVTLVKPMAHVRTLGRWNQMTVEAAGATVEVRVNNVVTARIESDRPQNGHIALQYAGTGGLRIRGLNIEKL